MYLLILFLIILLIIFIYNNTNYNSIEDYTPKDDELSFDVRLCTQETPEYDREYDLNDLKIINIINKDTNSVNKDTNKVNEDANIVNNDTNKIKLARIKTHIEDPYYHTFNLESIDNFELTKSDYSIINNIKLKENQSYVPKNYSFNIE